MLVSLARKAPHLTEQHRESAVTRDDAASLHTAAREIAVEAHVVPASSTSKSRLSFREEPQSLLLLQGGSSCFIYQLMHCLSDEKTSRDCRVGIWDVAHTRPPDVKGM